MSWPITQSPEGPSTQSPSCWECWRFLKLSHSRSGPLCRRGPEPMASQCRDTTSKPFSPQIKKFRRAVTTQELPVELLILVSSSLCRSALPSVPSCFLPVLLVFRLRAHSITFPACKLPPQSLFLPEVNLRQFTFGYYRG